MFDYLAVLISVVLGLAVTHVLTGISGAINRRHHVRLEWVQLFWAVNVLAYVLAVMFGFGPRGVFLAIMIAFSTLAIVSALVFRRGKWKGKAV